MKKVFRPFVFILIAVLCVPLIACVRVDAGKSAYDIACEQGFKGTEAEWLLSLNGKDGKDAEPLDIYSLFDAYLEQYAEATFEEFIKTFINADYRDAEYAAAKGIRSAVEVFCRFSNRGSEYYSAGSGVIYKIENGYVYIITNYHVIHDIDSTTADKISDEITVFTYGDDNEIIATFIGGSISKDIAVVRAPYSYFPDTVRAAEIADSNEIALGERVVAIGNPLAEGLSVTSGILSVDSETIKMEALDSPSTTVDMRVMRTDTSVNQGNSGGGLYNARGQLVGIVNAKTIDSGVESIGYAIPVNIAVGIAECVIYNNAQKCVLGITVIVEDSRAIYNTQSSKLEIIETIKVEEVGKTAFAYGKLLKGDILLSISLNGQDELVVKRIFHISDYLYKVRTGDVISLKVKRNDVTVTVNMTAADVNFAAV